MDKVDQLSPLALAFMGDAVHTAFVREEVLKGNINKINNYHNLAKKYCNAKKQQETLEYLQDSLSDEEKDIVRKARNCKSKHGAKNFDEETYKKATAFEALIGYLYLKNRQERLKEILMFSIKDREVKNEN